MLSAQKVFSQATWLVSIGLWFFALAVVVSMGGAGNVLAQSQAAGAAQGYPNRAIRMIVPFPAGGGYDFMARNIGQKLTETWGQPVVVDNRVGANGRPRAVNRVPACGMRTSASRDARR